MQAKVVLGLAKYTDEKIIVVSGHFTGNMTNNVIFTAADIQAQVTATKSATTALSNALALPTSDFKKATIRQCRDALDRALTILAHKVEAQANAPLVPDDQREGIINNAGMEMRKYPRTAKNVCSV